MAIFVGFGRKPADFPKLVALGGDFVLRTNGRGDWPEPAAADTASRPVDSPSVVYGVGLDQGKSRSARRSTLPTIVLGSSLLNSTRDGTL